jgi:hypothetical protein
MALEKLRNSMYWKQTIYRVRVNGKLIPTKFTKIDKAMGFTSKLPNSSNGIRYIKIERHFVKVK